MPVGRKWDTCRAETGSCRREDGLRRHLYLKKILSMAFSQVDMLVGDIYGGRDYSTIGLSATTIASSFGKVIGQVWRGMSVGDSLLSRTGNLHLSSAEISS